MSCTVGVGVIHQVPRSSMRILGLIYIFKFFGYGQGGHGAAKTGAYYYHIGLNIADFCKTTWNTMLPNDIGYYPEFFNVNTSTNRSLLSILKRPLSSM